MSAYVDWNFYGKNTKTGNLLTSKQIEAFVALDEFDLLNDNFSWDTDYYEFGEGYTESSFAVDHIRETVEKFSKLYPEIRIVALYKYDIAWNPDGFIAENGEVREITGHVKYTYDDNGEEVTI